MMMPKDENLKNIWKKQEDCKIKFSKEDINKMIYKKSSSIVKWILIISILEFILPHLLLFFTGFDTYKEFYLKYDMLQIMKVYFSIHFFVILSFVYIFYKNYKSISAGNSVKDLLKNIIKTRKTVKYYIYYNIGIAAVIGVHVFYNVFTSNTFKDSIPEDTNLVMVWGLALVLFSFVLFVFWGLYRLIYGFFLKKLNQNYAELEKEE